MVRPGDRVLVALSAGPDSTGMLVALYHSRRALGVELVAGHVHHGLRGADADADAQCAAESAAQLGIPFARADLRAQRLHGGNLEERARSARYAALHKLAEEHGCRRIATGHSLDDQAETVLMRLVRGCGSDGLGGIEPVREDGVIRPVLDCTRAELSACARASGLTTRSDAMNLDWRFQRVFVRHEILPLLARLNPRYAEAMARLAEAVRGDEMARRAGLDAILDRTRTGADLSRSALTALSADLRGATVRHWLESLGAGGRTLRRQHVDLIVDLAAGGGGRGAVRLPSGFVVSRHARVLRAVPAKSLSKR